MKFPCEDERRSQMRNIAVAAKSATEKSKS